MEDDGGPETSCRDPICSTFCLRPRLLTDSDGVETFRVVVQGQARLPSGLYRVDYGL